MIRQSPCVTLLVTYGADMETRDKRGPSALRIAADNNQLRTIRYLLEKEENISLGIQDEEGVTALIEAASMRSE